MKSDWKKYLTGFVVGIVGGLGTAIVTLKGLEATVEQLDRQVATLTEQVVSLRSSNDALVAEILKLK